MSPQDQKVLQVYFAVLSLTDFGIKELRFAPKPHADRLSGREPPRRFRPLFAAGGTGEFFSLEPGEYSEVIKARPTPARTARPSLSGAGGGTTPGHQVSARG